MDKRILMLSLSASATLLFSGVSSNTMPSINNQSRIICMKSDSSDGVDTLSSSSYKLNSKEFGLNNGGMIKDAKDLFGDMTYLSKEGQEEYNEILDSIFEDTDIKLFDFV